MTLHTLDAAVIGLNARAENLSPHEIIALALEQFAPDIVFANSFGLEDVALQHMLLSQRPRPESIVLDTGRLPAETYDLIERWRLRFGIDFKLMSPKPESLEPFVRRHGPNAFYAQPELRQTCCAIRKIEPLERALRGQKAWFTGLRRAQAQSRSDLPVFSLDGGQRVKISPLAAWSLDEVWAYIRQHDVPYNVLHDRGYPSIGCAPCTRAVAPGEDLRSGRWWWELSGARECGLHMSTQKGTTHALESK